MYQFEFKFGMALCLKRLRREISALKKADDDPEILLTPKEDNIKVWTAFIAGPPESPYHGRFFSMLIEVGGDYPQSPPTITFVTKVFHPNVNFDSGEICLDILKREWTPAWSLEVRNCSGAPLSACN